MLVPHKFNKLFYFLHENYLQASLLFNVLFPPLPFAQAMLWEKNTNESKIMMAINMYRLIF